MHNLAEIKGYTVETPFETLVDDKADPLKTRQPGLHNIGALILTYTILVGVPDPL